jgi:hypothetical protein
MGIKDYILDWYKLHKRGADGKATGTSVNGAPFPGEKDIGETDIDENAMEEEGVDIKLSQNLRRQDLKAYLRKQLPDINISKINEGVIKYADAIEYDDDSFTYGEKNRGGRRRTLKRRKGKRRQTMKKAKTVKTVKRSIGKRNTRYLRKRKTRK